MNNKPIRSWDDLPLLMPLPIVAQLVGLTPEHLSNLAKAGKFPAHRVGHQWRVERGELMRYLGV